jgi:pimeloyl-ACP methyl ester carboxylesterase
MGGGIAMQIAIRHPDLVRKLVFAGGTAYTPDGFHPEGLGGMMQMRPEDLAGTPFHQAYLRAVPNPEDWPALIARITELFRNWAGFAPEVSRSVKAPTLRRRAWGRRDRYQARGRVNVIWSVRNHT